MQSIKEGVHSENKPTFSLDLLSVAVVHGVVLPTCQLPLLRRPFYHALAFLLITPRARFCYVFIRLSALTKVTRTRWQASTKLRQ